MKKAKVEQNGRQHKKASRHLGKGKVTRAKTEQTKRTSTLLRKIEHEVQRHYNLNIHTHLYDLNYLSIWT